MNAPVPVRVMSEGEVTTNIGDDSNQASVAETSALEKPRTSTVASTSPR